jgi:hypothetical protein
MTKIPVLFLAIALLNAVVTAGAALYTRSVARHGLANSATAARFAGEGTSEVPQRFYRLQSENSAQPMETEWLGS